MRPGKSWNRQKLLQVVVQQASSLCEAFVCEVWVCGALLQPVDLDSGRGINALPEGGQLGDAFYR